MTTIDRSLLRAFVNSEQEKDKERALQLCKRFGLDYDELRKKILAEMVAYEKQRLSLERHAGAGEPNQHRREF